jgi:hypothetical protein
VTKELEFTFTLVWAESQVVEKLGAASAANGSDMALELEIGAGWVHEVVLAPPTTSMAVADKQADPFTLSAVVAFEFTCTAQFESVTLALPVTIKAERAVGSSVATQAFGTLLRTAAVDLTATARLDWLNMPRKNSGFAW